MMAIAICLCLIVAAHKWPLNTWPLWLLALAWGCSATVAVVCGALFLATVFHGH